MDRGTWKLICQSCEKEFEVEIKPGERVIIFAKETSCPECGVKPDGKKTPWHHVIGFHSTRDD